MFMRFHMFGEKIRSVVYTRDSDQLNCLALHFLLNPQLTCFQVIDFTQSLSMKDSFSCRRVRKHIGLCFDVEILEHTPDSKTN